MMTGNLNGSGGGRSGGGRGGGEGPCGACKFLRRKCVKSCVFAPYFDSEQGGTTRFAAVHKVFGASNASKMLLSLPTHKRLDAVVTLSYEALARLRDPVYGSVGHLFSLQHQVMNLQTELANVQARLSTFQRLPPQPPQPQQQPLLTPSLGNNPSFDYLAYNNHDGYPIEEPISNFDVVWEEEKQEEEEQLLQGGIDEEDDGGFQEMQFVSRFLPAVKFPACTFG